MTDDGRDEARLLDYLHDKALERRHAYEAQGRRFARLAGEALEAEWADAFIAMCLHGDASRIQDVDDLTAEIGLRRMPVPAHLVHHVMPGIVERARQWLTAVRPTRGVRHLSVVPRLPD